MISITRWRWVPGRLWFIFNIWFSLLVVGGSAAVSLHVSMARAAWPILILCCVLTGVLGIRSLHSRPVLGPNWRWLPATFLILVAVILVLWGSLIKGEFVSVFPDPWSYSALAAYLQNPIRLLSDGSQPVLSFGSGLIGSRYGTAGLLALFAEISKTDTCQAAEIFAFLVLCQIGFGFALLARALRAGPILSLVAGLFGVMLGWAPEMLKIGNWDQVLFVSFIPFAICRIKLLCLPTSRRSGFLGLGVCLAAAMFTYPEGTAISGVIYLPLIVWRVLRGKSAPEKIRKFAMASGFAILLTAVYLPTFVSFLFHQISASSAVLLAEGVLAGLRSVNWLPASYCLGAEFPLTTARAIPKLEVVVAVLFLGLSLVSLGSWWRRRDGILLTIPMFLALIGWQAFLKGYDYGVYKVLTMFWPVMVGAVFVGISQLLARYGGLARLLAAFGFCGLIAGTFVVELDSFQYAPWRHERSIRPFVELSRLKEKFGNVVVRIQTEDWFNQMWAVFFLQGYKIEVRNPLLYLRNPSAGLSRRVSEPWTEGLVLTDEKRPDAIWHNELFSLSAGSDPVELVSINAPNDVETVDGQKFVWLDNQFADLTIRSSTDCRGWLVIPECRPGYSRPGDPIRTLVVEANGERFELPAEKDLKIPLLLRKGNNLVRLACKERSTAEKLSSGDPRTLLLGIKGFSVRVAD
jgi:hypothetical protein